MSQKHREILNLSGGDAPEIVAGELLGDLRLRAGTDDRIEASSDGAEAPTLVLGEDGLVRLECRGDLKLVVPPGARLRLAAIRGDARIKGLLGGLSIGEVSGDLRIQASGPAELGSVFGDLSAAGIVGDMRVDRVLGDALLREIEGDLVLGSVGADLTLRAVSGRIEASVGADAVIDLSDQAAPRAVVKAGADLSLRLSPESSLRLEANSGAGEIELLLGEGAEASEAREDGSLRLELGAGEGELILDAGRRLRIDAVGGEPGWSTNQAQWVEMGEEFKTMADQFARRMEAQMSSMSESLSERLAHLSQTLPGVLAAAGLSEAEAERIALKIRRAGERAGEQAQVRVERVMREAERKMASAERQAASAGRRGRHEMRRRWVFMPESPGAPQAPREPVSPEERMAVLRMLEAGRISSEEAERLLAVMEGREVRA